MSGGDMQPLARFSLLASVTMLAPATASTQQPPRPDTRRIFIAPPTVQVRQPTVLALVGDSFNVTDPRFAPVRLVAESLGFTFMPVLIGELKVVVDSRYHAIYSLPS